MVSCFCSIVCLHLRISEYIKCNLIIYTIEWFIKMFIKLILTFLLNIHTYVVKLISKIWQHFITNNLNSPHLFVVKAKCSKSMVEYVFSHFLFVFICMSIFLWYNISRRRRISLKIYIYVNRGKKITRICSFFFFSN